MQAITQKSYKTPQFVSKLLNLYYLTSCDTKNGHLLAYITMPNIYTRTAVSQAQGLPFINYTAFCQYWQFLLFDIFRRAKPSNAPFLRLILVSDPVRAGLGIWAILRRLRRLTANTRNCPAQPYTPIRKLAFFKQIKHKIR